MLKTLARWLAVAIVVLLITFALFSREGAGWRWLTKGGWHTTARISSLTPQEKAWARIAWRYFENNTQPQTGLVNGSDKQPRVTLWQMGDTLIALIAARELGLVQEDEFDARLTRLLGTLNRLTLTDVRTPGRLYSSQTATPVDFSGQPTKSGWSAKDMARLMLALRLTAERAPQYREYLDKIILRWNFCPVIDKDGELWSASVQNGQTVIREELRLGESEYAASAFRLWGFLPEKALSPPSCNVIIYQRSLAVDDRDPRTTWQPSLLTTLPAMLPGLEFGWQPPGVPPEVQKALRTRAQGVWLSQKSRWERDKVLTARADFTLPQAPWHVVDTVWGNGYAWNTIGDDGRDYPRLAQVSTKAVFVLWTLWKTDYTDALMAVTTHLNNPQRGWFEGRVEATGDVNRTLTLSTNAMVLEALLYKHNAGPLFENGLTDDNSYFVHRATDEFNPPSLCLPGERAARTAP
ncbi:DUF3131 domain-containing protein [Salmonella enterica subsp. enterica]|uniref:DUF3131 domain-containing protein n=1 Tax=Salmonella enterica TaxID=28901 RepID=UPI0009B18776|nr:DUF3131 domain-containing protein [Salmonella enterica]EBY6678813.1 DUF3131 domain-containing protein [Salmonella enterica subsp. enterica serovar Saphra]EDV1284626.1 DUF3131 domain-containing protein [Salmonella enterica subsp. enterica]EEN5143604.1 DUF3131 domain-containing protein [Salmonella enterica subsp. enterica serovar Oranienburg]EEP8162943.1 DUF3131 domain-containing protein [Salmonella enterica subsp. enterica serovar Poona]QVB78754.1 DUF3131 domain-containing protein [Salmonell